MKVLLLGGAGCIGVMATAHLLRQGFEVSVFDKCIFGASALLAFSEPSFRFIHGDIRDAEALFAAMKGMDAVVHLAALVGEPACLVDPATARSINLGGTELALSVAQKCDVERFIFVSTCSNYGISTPNTVVTEESPLNPIAEYAISKVLAEQAVLSTEAPFTTTILRFGTICGLSPRMRFDLLVNDMARAAVLDMPIKVFAPDAWRPFLHIKDAVRVIEHCLKTPGDNFKSKIYNVLSENYRKRDLVDLVQRYFPHAFIEVMDNSSDPRNYRVSCERIRKELDFSPNFSVEQAFLEAAQAIKQKFFLDPLWPGFSGVPESAESLKMK
jgi:nucleoside-diphosphate-sugar epimerase